ncbi:PH domain-containing protein [Natronobacterium texcoconense]|uniref:PH domain-containing protein n=1 Tax=Natronobacterium texcoconense TaxID=1095778 RepID=A0A1H0ZS79_NATTX|nr:PH domain-containing protein [Natronobacterium texcoconense]SDQ30253.1 PH domain-containing protein [Natronobacterium texcoconense]
MATSKTRPLPGVGEIDVGFKAAVGFYAGILVAGAVSAAGLLAGWENETVVSTFPTVVTIVTIAGIVLLDRSPGLPQRLGRNRQRRLCCYLPSIALGGTLVAYAYELVSLSSRLALLVGILFVVSIPLSIGTARMARNRYVDALAADEPTATWPLHRAGPLSSEYVATPLLILSIPAGIWLLRAGYGLSGLFLIGYGVVMLHPLWMPGAGGWDEFDPVNRRNPPELHAHEAGVLVEKPLSKRLVPWDKIEAVRLTDEELVLERRGWFDLPCDREAIDDPEGTFEGIERVRRGETVDGSK